MTNVIYIGLEPEIEYPNDGLLICDEVPQQFRKYRDNIFTPRDHSINPLENNNDKTAREQADNIYTIYPQGANTLTVRDGLIDLAPALRTAKRLDELHKVAPSDEIVRLEKDILFAEVTRKALTYHRPFTFKKNTLSIARISRAKLGLKDARILTYFLMSYYKGQIILPDAGDYLTDTHINLLLEKRLIFSVTYLKELPEKFKRAALIRSQRIPSKTNYEDAAELATYDCPFPPHTDGYDTFIKKAMGHL